jgi:hypothetical protein
MNATDANHRSTSQVLLEVMRNHPGERMSIQDIMDGLAERSFGFLLLLFGLISAIAIVPGLATITAVPLLFFSLQMLAGAKTPWLPRSIAGHAFLKSDLEKTIQRGIPLMRRVETLCRPRLLFLTGGFGERLLGLIVFVLAVVIALPGPGTNFLPGVATAFMAIAIINRDGLLVLIGWLVSAAALYVAALALAWVATDVAPALWQAIFGSSTR